ncbi:unnamed protein product [[Actinomadura] parvosata subsp. kistnae]|uniref:Uncharacterized protein n=1 Tax=[Actinomadura] parvosata subsp. kistnae TaxID=1909395 RepID=A0A1V0AC02_9ACTN|nr:hypothetical protein BKM31_45285 [Nonomuraea sp. ATCC 55076]SPL93977.1 unnamed protein product [Actinomadura parvosata subsp. kistnae]
MTGVEPEAAAAIERYFARFGRRRHRLARLYGSTVQFLVAAHGLDVLGRVEVDAPCSCCDEEQARRARLSAMRAEYRRRRA